MIEQSNNYNILILILRLHEAVSIFSRTNKQIFLYFKVHIQTAHSAPKSYNCNECDRTFTNMSHLKIHKKTHTGLKDLACAICQRTFGQKCHLAVHMKNAHKVKVMFTFIMVWCLSSITLVILKSKTSFGIFFSFKCFKFYLSLKT